MTTSSQPTDLDRYLCCNGKGASVRWHVLNVIDVCSRCEGTGLDPSRNENWFIDIVVPERLNVEAS